MIGILPKSNQFLFHGTLVRISSKSFESNFLTVLRTDFISEYSDTNFFSMIGILVKSNQFHLKVQWFGSCQSTWFRFLSIDSNTFKVSRFYFREIPESRIFPQLERFHFKVPRLRFCQNPSIGCMSNSIHTLFISKHRDTDVFKVSWYRMSNVFYFTVFEQTNCLPEFPTQFDNCSESSRVLYADSTTNPARQFTSSLTTGLLCQSMTVLEKVSWL